MSQFIEMYYNTHNKQTLESVCPIMSKGITPKYVESSSVLVINQACIHWDGQRLGNIKYHNEEIPVRKRILESGDVLLNATGNGTLGRCCVFICPSDNNTYINDGHVIALSTDRAVILPEVLNTYLSLNDTQAEIYRQYVTGSTNQVDIVFSDIKKMKVPVPSMDEQILFVEVLKQADKSKFGDFKSQFIEMFGNPLSLNQKNELKRLGECCILNPRRPNIALCDTDKVSFIPMPAVSEDGYLVDMTDEEYGKVKKGFTYFENNDVLFAKITPCMENGKGAIVHGLTNGIGMGSTEFHVLRPINGISSPYWLLALTRMPIFRERAAKNMSGTGGQKRVSASYLDHFMVGLPAIEEQRRFEAIYRQADKSKFGDFKSQFIEMYYNTHNKQTLESVCPIMSKGITPKYVESSSVLVINQACIHWDGQRLGNIKYHNEEIPVRKRILESGDVLLNATGNGTLGRCCVFICPSDNNTYINDGHVIALSTDRAVILPEVLNTYLSLNDTQAEIYRQYVTGSTNQVDIVFSDIKKMKVPVPSMDEQILFVEVLKQADKSKFGDFKSQFIEMFGNPLSLNQKNELKRLGECCILNPRRPNIALCDTDKVSFIPMPAVSEDGYLVDMTDEEYGKVKKGFTYFENNDVLFAKITPCMENGKGAIVHGLTNGIGMGSTEFHVLRPINGISSPYWLLALTRMPIFRERAAKNMSGTGGQKRVSASYLDHFMVGLPAIEEQRRFEAIYKQADKSKSVIQKALVYLNDIQSDELGKIA